jgi:hypothetical protein
MRVRNVHRRTIGSRAQLGALLDSLASDADGLWPGDRWPRLRLDGPLRVGARGGHGPVGYRVELYEPQRRVRFRFERPRGFDGVHEFRVVADVEGPAQLVHELQTRMSGTARFSWPLLFRPLHNALIEDTLDNAERQVTGKLQHPARWSTYVRALRRVLALARRVLGRRPGGRRGTASPHVRTERR